MFKEVERTVGVGVDDARHGLRFFATLFDEAGDKLAFALFGDLQDVELIGWQVLLDHRSYRGPQVVELD
jgi:hypothetical protein